MINIIDANNLAGRLKLLSQDAFDEKLIRMLSQYKKSKYILVFDGRDIMGDKHTRGNVTVIYTPRDSFYKSADDKIAELAREYLNSGEGAKIITDDLEIISKVQKIIDDNGGKIILEKASWFAEKLNNYIINKKTENKFTETEMDEINQDLLKAWK
jgi:predicted RNA-binding protein with PIN domain